MKFQDFEYVRPDMEQMKAEFDALISAFNAAERAEVQLEIVGKINAIRNRMESLAAIVQVRHTINTEDAFYDAENNFIDEAMPIYQEMVDKYYRAMNASPFKEALKKELGEHIFNKIGRAHV